MINSLKIQLSGAIIITDSDQLEQIKHHNKKPKAQSIISSMNGMKFQTPIPGLLNTNADTTKKENNTATTTTITFVTITTNNTTRFQYAWWDTQGSNSSDTSEAIEAAEANNTIWEKKLTAKRSQSSSFVRHLDSIHNFTKEKQLRYLLQLLTISEEAAPDEESESNFVLKIFKNFTDKKNQQAVQESIHSQEAFDSNQQILEFNRETFLNLLVTFIIANRLPSLFAENNDSFKAILGFCANFINTLLKMVPANKSSTLVTVPSATAILQLPSRLTIKTKLLEKFDSNKQMIQRLLESQSAISFTTDVWKSSSSTV